MIRPFTHPLFLGVLAALALPSAAGLYSDHFPVRSDLKQEHLRLRASRKLTTENEITLNRHVVAASEQLHVPSAVLWCLLFQESRLDHLLGMGISRGPHGIGQFNRSGFYEINHELERYHPSTKRYWLKLYGKDVRPIGPLKAEKNRSSYFHLPTAVAATASYLNNRYWQLYRILERQQIDPNPELLWLFAAMAYNKGTRSVISLWTQIQKRDPKLFRRAVTDPAYSLATLDDERLLLRSLKRVWPSKRATDYAREWRIHWTNIRDCAVQDGGA